MKFTVLQENLSKALNQIGRLTTTRTTLPILNNVLIEAEKGLLKLTTTNLEIAIISQIRAKVDQEIKITIPCQILLNFIGFLDKGPIEIELLENSEITLKAKNSFTKIKGILAEEFPIVPQVNKDKFFKIEAGVLQQALNKVIFTISPNESRAEISGVFLSFNPENKDLTLVGTDSYRLAEKTVKIKETNITQKHNLIIPFRTIQEVVRLLEEEGTVEIYLSENQILFIYDTVEIVSRIINGEYPDYKQIIPQSFTSRALLEKDALLKAVKAVSLFTKSGLNDIHLNFQASKDLVIVSSLNSQVGESQMELKGELKGEDNEIVFNYRYLLDGLLNIDSPEINVNIVNDKTPAVITAPEEKDYLYLVMPIKK